MRKSLMLIGIPVVLAGAAVAIVIGRHSVGANSSDKFNDDLQQAQAAGLDLAQSQASKKYALTEIAPISKPQQSKSLRLGVGPRVIRSKAPTLKASPEPAPAAAVAPAPEPTPVAPEPTPQPAPVPQPVVAPQPEPGPILAGGTGRGTGRTGSGTGGTVGTGTSILGSILGARAAWLEEMATPAIRVRHGEAEDDIRCTLRSGWEREESFRVPCRWV
jgi:hypothetical protein